MFYVILLLLFLLGLSVGSFVNVVIYRLPIGKNFVNGRSKCPHCGHELFWSDLIPIIGLVILRRRCRYCGVRISWIYPAIELYSGLIFILSFMLLGSSGWAVWTFSVFLLETFLILAVIDFKHLILPDSVIMSVLAAALFYGVFQRVFWQNGPFIFSFEHLVTAVTVFSVFFAVWFFSGGKWLGLGDAKLAGLVGFIFGGAGAAIILYASIVAGALVGLILMLTKRAGLKTKLPLGSFIGFSSSLYILMTPFIMEKTKFIFRFVIPLFK